MAAKKPRISDEPEGVSGRASPASPVTPSVTCVSAPVMGGRQLGIVAWLDAATGFGALVPVNQPSVDAPASESSEAKHEPGLVYFHTSKLVGPSESDGAGDSKSPEGEASPFVPFTPIAGSLLSFDVLKTPDTTDVWADNIRNASTELIQPAVADRTPVEADAASKVPRFPETSWDIDPSSFLSNSWTKPGADDGKRAPDPLGIVWHTESWTGLKPTQEDRMAAGRTRIKGVTYRYFGVFDGHGGPQCSEFLRKKLHTGVMNHIRQAPRVRKHAREEDSGFAAVQTQLMTNAIVDTFKRVDGEFLEQARRNGWGDGSTALVVMLAGNHSSDALLTVANVGDCRAVLCCGGAAVRLSEDHKPGRNDERNRIAAAGGTVLTVMGIHRVGCVSDGIAPSKRTWLSVSRSFGDISLKEPTAVVVSTPEITMRPIGGDDWFFVIACDGVWDVLSDQEVVDVVLASGRDEKGESLDVKAAATAVVRTAHQRKSADNLTATVVMFPWQASAVLEAGSKTVAPSAVPTAPVSAAVDALDDVEDMFG
jgi:serine/threonine protein phosphatase PrpC